MQCHAWGRFRQRCRQEQQQTHDTRPGASVMFSGPVQALCPDTIPAPMMERYLRLASSAWAFSPADHENVIMRRMEDKLGSACCCCVAKRGMQSWNLVITP